MKNVHRLSRRSLLGASAAVGSAGLVLAACGQVQTTGAPMEQAADAPQGRSRVSRQVVEHAPVVASADQSTRETRLPRTAATLELFDHGPSGGRCCLEVGLPAGRTAPAPSRRLTAGRLLVGRSPASGGRHSQGPPPDSERRTALISDEFVEPVVTGNTWQGKLLGVPYGLNTTSLFYNKQHFDTAGLNYPDGRHNLGAGPR